MTGAASGLGAAIASQLGHHGYHIIVTDLDLAGAEALASRLPLGNAYQLDVSDAENWGRFANWLGQEFGQIDVLVNNAAIYQPRAICDETADGVERIFRVNQLSVFLGLKMASSLMKDNEGSVINISSTGGLRGYPGTLAYASTKWAVRGMSKVAAVELAPLGIRVNSVHPGLCDTPMAYENTPELLNSLTQSIPLGRLGKPEEIASTVLFLAGNESSYITGTEIIVDGAATA